MTEIDIDSLRTTSQVAAHLRSLGLNIIPIAPGTKAPPAGFEMKKYFDVMCDYPITDEMSIAILHGKISNTFAVDIDMKSGGDWKNAIEIVAADQEKILSRTMVIKTPKQGCHFILSPIGELPPKNTSYFNKDGIEIDIKTEGGYTLLPPSVHPERQFGKYQFISNTLDRNPTNWSAFEIFLAKKGFFRKEDIDKKMHNDYDLTQLLSGKFVRGERRRSMNSLYCKLRVRGNSREEATNTINRINRKLPEPLDVKEVQYNIQYAERFYTDRVAPSIEEELPITNSQNNNLSQTPAKVKKKNAMYQMAFQLMNEYQFISHISGEIYYYSNGIYHKNGEDLIKLKAREYWESIGIMKSDIAEIISIIQDKTKILNEDENQDIFDQDYTKIILKNGYFDLDTMQFMPHDSTIFTLIKHPIFFDDVAECPKFDKFLDSCFEEDEKSIAQVWEMMALCFIKKYVIQKGYVNYGIGSNGKSTLLNILRNMIGIQNTCTIPMQEFQKSSYIGYDLKSKSANISADGGTEPIMKTGFIKEVLGGDAVRCEQKYRDSYSYIPFCTMIFTFNELPMVNDSSDGFARKIQPIHWSKRFYGKDRDFEVDKIAYDITERSGIFNKLVRVMNRLLRERKLSYENTVEETKAVWLSRSDSFFKFKNDKISMGDYKICIEKVRESYKKFCDDNGMTAINDRQLHNKLSELLNGSKPTPTRINGVSCRAWNGFTIDSELRDEKQAEI